MDVSRVDSCIAGVENGNRCRPLDRMFQFAEVFPDREIVVSSIRQLTWTHFIALIPLDRPLQREFYAEMCRVERWSVSTLRKKIGGMLYQRRRCRGNLKNSPLSN